MELSDQCVNLELSKRLKELGCQQDSLFYINNNNEITIPIKVDGVIVTGLGEHYSAYTVAELGALIPFTIEHKDEGTLFCNQMIGYTKHGYHPAIHYTTSDDNSKYGCACVVQDFSDDNEANARAKMLIWLIENGHINISNETK